MNKFRSINSTILDDLNDSDLKRLYSYGRSLAARHPHSLLSGEEILHSAIEQVLSLERPWDQSKCPLLYAHLAGCMRSIAFNASVRIREISYMETDDYTDVNLSGAMTYEHAENILILQEHIDGFIGFVSQQTPALTQLAIAIVKKEISKNQELAKYLGKDVTVINNDKKRLKRLYAKYTKEV